MPPIQLQYMITQYKTNERSDPSMNNTPYILISSMYFISTIE